MIKYGSAEARTGFKRQREYMGELAWAVCERQGGYQHLCDSTTNDDLPTLKAQWRGLALALCDSSRAGTIDQPPALPSSVHQAIEGLAESVSMRNLLGRHDA
jgi:hypothetical protein